MARLRVTRHVFIKKNIFLALSLSYLLSSTAVQQLSAQEPATSSTDIFSVGDILKISAYGRDDLTGQYTVQPGPAISLPLIGPVELGTQTPRQLELELAKAWENRLGGTMSVTIEFTQRAPFYVIGAVSSPGAYPYKTGMNVLQAIASSGGLEKYNLNDPGGRIELIREGERRLQAIEKLTAGLVRRARLLAERNGNSTFNVERGISTLPIEQVNSMIAEEKTLLKSRRQYYASREDLLLEQIKLAEAEIAAYQRQFDTLDKQQDQITKEVVRAKRLAGQQVRAFELEQRSTTLEATKASIRASITRGRIAAATARREIAQLELQRQSELSEALLQVERDIADASQIERSARSILDFAGQGSSTPKMVFKVLRSGSSDFQTVSSSSLIQPGDVIEVSVSGVSAIVPVAANQ